MIEATTEGQRAPLLIKERDDGVLIARLNRPERMNALGGGLREQLNAAWFEFRDDPDLKVMIVTGTGDRAFCTGMDLRESDQRARDIGAQSAQACSSRFALRKSFRRSTRTTCTFTSR